MWLQPCVGFNVLLMRQNLLFRQDFTCFGHTLKDLRLSNAVLCLQLLFRIASH